MEQKEIKDPKDPKDQIIQTMVTKEDRELLQNEADTLGMTMSAYLRNIIMHRSNTPIYGAIDLIRNEVQK